MPNLYPEITPYTTFRLPVGQGHTLHVEVSGNPKGTPVVFLHGGPGAGLPTNYRRFFHPDLYHIIGFDQRGCGQSQPFADLKNNTIEDLIADIEQIRQHLGISTWLVFGGSWGATLALVYAIRHTANVMGLILRGTFLARQQDIDWFLHPEGGAANLFPEQYQQFAANTEFADSSQAICERYYEIFKHADEISQAHALKSWYSWEERISKLVLPNPSNIDTHHFHLVKSLAMLECHYISNQCFIPENYILNNVSQLAALPVTIVHGRYDVICKMSAAYALHTSLPNSVLQIVPDAGHSTAEIGIAKALCKATDDFARFQRDNK